MSLHNNMVAVNKLESLLIVPLLVFSIAAQENSGYGLPNFSSSGRGFTGPSENTGSDGRTGPSGLPTARGRILGPSAPTARGRIVSNSILDFEPGPMERDNGSRQGYSRQQPGFTSRPITTGPSVVGTNLIDERNSQSNVNPNTQEQKIYRYLSIHVPPEMSPPPQRPRPTHAPVKPETHYQIVFIKAPSPISQELQEIQLPPPPEMKTLVYVLLKKPSMSDLVKISQRPKPKVNKPEVFFLRYSQPKGNQQLPFQAQPERRQQDGMQQFPTQQQPEGRQQFPQQQPDGRQQFPQQQQERRQQYPQQQQERRQQFPQQQEEIQQFSQQQEGRQFPQQQQGRNQPIPLQRASNNGSNIGNNVVRQSQQQNVGSVLETSASPAYGGYENSPDSIADSDYQHETADENSFSLSSYDQGLLPEYSYTPTSQYGITS